MTNKLSPQSTSTPLLPDLIFPCPDYKPCSASERQAQAVARATRGNARLPCTSGNAPSRHARAAGSERQSATMSVRRAVSAPETEHTAYTLEMKPRTTRRRYLFNSLDIILLTCP